MNEAKFKVTILGWWGAFPQGGEATACVLVETHEGKFLIDCGSGALSRLHLHTGPETIDAIVLSHLHQDHIADVGCLQYATNYALRVGKRPEKLRIYAPMTPVREWELLQADCAVVEGLAEDSVLSIAQTTITLLKINHGVECYGFRVAYQNASFVYLSDTEYISHAGAFADQSDLLICEATCSVNTRHSVGAGHMSDIEAGTIAQAAKAKQLCLFHLPSDGDLPLMRERAASVYDGPVFTPDIQSVFIIN